MEENPQQTASKSSKDVNRVGKNMILSLSQYAKVIFHDVWDWYPTDADIMCRYTVTKDVVAYPNDKIALLPVGWTSATEDAILAIPVPTPSTPQVVNTGLPGNCRQGKIVLKVQDIPKDLREFYQICYVSHPESGSATVCGASAPFQFLSPQDEDWCEVEDDEDGILIVRSRAAVDQENLQKALKEGEQLQLEKKQVETELKRITKDLSECQLEAGKLRTEIETLKAERLELQNRVGAVENVESYVLRLQGEARALDADRNETGDKLGHAQRHIQVLEATIATLTADKEHMLELLRSETQRGGEMSKRLEEVLLERENLKKEVKSLQEEKEKLNEKLMSASEEMSVLKSTVEERGKNSSDEIKSLCERLRQTEKKLEASQLQTAELDALYQKQSKQLEDELGEVKRLKEQVSEMQLRLEMAAEEYKKVYAAHMRAERRLRRRQSSGGRSASGDDSGGGSKTRESRETRRTLPTGMLPTDGETGEHKVGANSSLRAREDSPASSSSSAVDKDTKASVIKPAGNENKSSVMGKWRALESLHDMNICFVCPICSVTFPPGESTLFNIHFENHLS